MTATTTLDRPAATRVQPHTEKLKTLDRPALPRPTSTLTEIATRAANSHCSVLIFGETGVGKGLLARWMHEHSPRANKAFVPVNCGAIPVDLIDSQLFGHARGSFSGATSDHVGLVRAADGGTLFLDEVGELPPTAQTRLLRLLQEGEAQPVGYSHPVTINVRVVAAANKCLQQAVRDGKFREDLYYRLDIVRLSIKPLRERAHEIPQLLEEFNAEFAQLYRRPPLQFDRAAMRLLESHPWPGNVRQLRTVVERLAVLCAGQRITTASLREYAHVEDAATITRISSAADQTMPTTIDGMRLQLARDAIAAANGRISRAAKRLGVHRSTLYRWLAAGDGPITV